MDLQWLLARRIPLLAVLAALVLLVWYLCYFHAMAPKKGTLEWISFAGLPPLSRPNICPIRGVCWIALPAALLLSPFTDNARAMLLGTDVGGLGTLVASLASLISYKYYARSEGADSGRYLLWFTALNLLLLFPLIALSLLLLA